MYKKTGRVRVKADGMVEIVDPCMEDLAFLKAIDPDYQILTSPLHGFTTPRFQALRAWHSKLKKEHISEVSSNVLMEIHSEEMEGIIKSNLKSLGTKAKGKATLLDLKIELARRELAECRLCGRNCSVNRLAGKFGFCGLGRDAYLGDSFLHIAEESPINPSLLIELYGCAMRCRFCQKPELHSVCREKVFDNKVWKRLKLKGARSLSFIGGNPDESLYAILRFLKSAPQEFNLPIVWNTHGFGNKVANKLLEGVVDVYIPDLKYGNTQCASEWSGVENYIETAHDSINEMVSQGVPVFVRILILPGHTGCCHIPSILWLRRHRKVIAINLMDQYYPEFGASIMHGAMVNRPDSKECKLIHDKAREAELHLISRGAK